MLATMPQARVEDEAAGRSRRHILAAGRRGGSGRQPPRSASQDPLGERGPKPEAPVRRRQVVVLNVLDQHAAEVALRRDQQPVQRL